MVCCECGGKLATLDSVKIPDDNEVYRRKRCLNCGHVMYTCEIEVAWELDKEFREAWSKYHRSRKCREEKKGGSKK